jgi:hypothetical protein
VTRIENESLIPYIAFGAKAPPSVLVSWRRPSIPAHTASISTDRYLTVIVMHKAVQPNWQNRSLNRHPLTSHPSNPIITAVL